MTWIPEKTDRPGVYARADVNGEFSIYTREASEALQFSTHEECLRWCREDEDGLAHMQPKEMP